ncbi:MAG: hypothetical protein ACOX1X_08405 [Dethiobacteria bacterium]
MFTFSEAGLEKVLLTGGQQLEVIMIDSADLLSLLITLWGGVLSAEAICRAKQKVRGEAKAGRGSAGRDAGCRQANRT